MESSYAKAYRSDVRGGYKPQKSVLHFSKTIAFASEISTDLSVGPGPKPKSVEFSDANVTVFEILDILRSNDRVLRFRQAATL